MTSIKTACLPGVFHNNETQKPMLRANIMGRKPERCSLSAFDLFFNSFPNFDIGLCLLFFLEDQSGSSVRSAFPSHTVQCNLSGKRKRKARTCDCFAQENNETGDMTPQLLLFVWFG